MGRMSFFKEYIKPNAMQQAGNYLKTSVLFLSFALHAQPLDCLITSEM